MCAVKSYGPFLARFVMYIALGLVVVRLFALFFNEDGPHSTPQFPSPAQQTNVVNVEGGLSSSALRGSSAPALNFTLPQRIPDKTSTMRMNSTQRMKRKPAHSTYTEFENTPQYSGVTWEEFLALPTQTPKTYHQLPRHSLDHVQTCDVAPMANTTSSRRRGCNEIWSDSLVSTWKERMVKGLCEDNANSKIRCFDSTTKARYCVFDNAMINFRKMRRRKQDGHVSRSWEKGFLSADCGEMAPEDIGYLQLYKPDIEGRESAVCDYVFNDTVLVYSHDNIRNFGVMISDYLNIWTTTTLAGLGATTRDVTLLNIDQLLLRRGGRGSFGHFANDALNQFFRSYEVSFRRVLRGADFAEGGVYASRSQSSQRGSSLCFKRLVLPPRPALSFQWEGLSDECSSSSSSSNIGGISGGGNSVAGGFDQSPSSLVQRWNLHLRSHYGLLQSPHATSDSEPVFQVLLSVRSPRPPSASASAASSSSTAGGSATSSSSSASSGGLPQLAKIMRNEAAVATALQQFLEQQQQAQGQSQTRYRLVVQDLSQLVFDEQVRLVASSHVLIGMHGVSTAAAVHMSVGGLAGLPCCGVLEIVPSLAGSGETGVPVAGSQVSSRGYAHLARRLGHVYERLDVLSDPSAGRTVRTDNTAGNSTSASSAASAASGGSGADKEGTEVPIDRLLSSLQRLLTSLLHPQETSRVSAACLMPEVKQTPFL